jgi:glycosyltransferase involved in cell wall biosynthesis
MRIALIAHTVSPWTGHYAAFLEEQGHTVRVISFSPDPLPGFDVRYVDAPSFLPRPIAYLGVAPRTAQLLRRFEPDIVFATYLSSNGMVAALATPRGTPLVVSARGGDVLRQAGYLPGGRFHARMMRAVCGRATLVHAVSEELVEALRTCGVPPDRIECFPVGIDLERFPARREGPPAGPPRIVCTRRQEPVYANDTVVEALGGLAARGIPFKATLVGGGPLLEERRAQVGELGLEDDVDLVGAVSLDRVGALLRESQVYVSASSSDGTSSSLLEALASGAFPVVSAIRANERWVTDGETGLLFTPGDSGALERALERALGDEPLRRAASAVNRDLVEREGNQAITMERLARLLERAAAGDPAGSRAIAGAAEHRE